MGSDKPGFLEWCGITEETIQENFFKVFPNEGIGEGKRIVAKLMYIYMAKG
jgi:hypothetical protein